MVDFDKPPVKDVIEILMLDMNTRKNILLDGKELTKKFLQTIKPRALKSADEKISRTRTNAEVFTPSRVVKFMVDALDDGLIDSRWLEIACGEAPFITNRYDAETAELIPLHDRAGILDRKLRAVANDKLAAKRAVQSVYGYELQADSLLIARANILLTFAEFVKDFSDSDLAEVAEIISWNFFQLDGMRDNGMFSTTIIDWREGRQFTFGGNTMKKFDFVIGNPPYNEETADTSDKPIYDKFMEAAYTVGEKVELITPARFLFNAGKTPKEFNRRMLDDPNLKVLDYAPDANKYFKGVDIKGGVAITLHDETKDFGAIGTFIPIDELKSVHEKVYVVNKKFEPLSSIIYPPESFHFSSKFHDDNPNAAKLLSAGHADDLTTNIFEKLSEIFFDEKPDDGNDYIQIFGLIKNRRAYKWIRRDYIRNDTNLDKFKVILPKSNGSGSLYEVLSTPLVGTTQTFITVGAFDTRAEAEACLKYIKSKFARAMLGILKVTQHNPPQTWSKVPLQDFTSASDIDWGGDVDAQLYRKYGLDDAEIKFIETHVKEMQLGIRNA